MNTQKYVSFKRDRHAAIKRRIRTAVIAAVAVLLVLFVIGKVAGNSDKYRESATLIEENRALREQIESLNARIAELEAGAAAVPQEEMPAEDEAPTEDTAPEDGAAGT